MCCGDYLHGNGENRSIDLCSRTCGTSVDDGGKPNSTYFTDCKVGDETFTKTITVYRSN